MAIQTHWSHTKLSAKCGTYGVISSSCLAIRTLFQLAKEDREQYPLTSDALKNDTYFDDLVCGASLETALLLWNQLMSLLQSACFELQKWSSNHPLVLENIPEPHRQTQNLDFDADSNSTIKILGLQWHSASDSFSFKVHNRESPCTKWTILSKVARIYDPQGFLSL